MASLAAASARRCCIQSQRSASRWKNQVDFNARARTLSSSSSAGKSAGKSAGNNNNGETARPTPLQAKRLWLESQVAANDADAAYANASAAAVKMSEELARLEDRINRPLRQRFWEYARHNKHALITLGVTTIAYLLAFYLSLSRKKVNSLREELQEQKESNEKMELFLRSLVDDDAALRAVVAECVGGRREAQQDRNEEERDLLPTRRSGRSSWWMYGSQDSSEREHRTSAASRTDSAVSSDDELQDRIVAKLRNELRSRVDAIVAPKGDSKKDSLDALLEENKFQVDKMSENPEMLLRALEGGNDDDYGSTHSDQLKNTKRVFSM